MKKTAFILALVLCITLVSCTGQKAKIYDILEKIDVSAEHTAFHIMVTNLSDPTLYTEQYPDEYTALAEFGKEGVPYILSYTLETPLNTLNAAFFVCCCYDILGIDDWLTTEPLGNIEAHITALQEYIDSNKYGLR